MDIETIIKEGPHKYYGIELNQLTWSLLGKPDRTTEEGEMMVHAAHGSYFHWMQEGTGATNANKQRGIWLLSHVYSVLNCPERAMYYAIMCKKITDEHKHEMEDFDLAYEDEALARAYACTGYQDESEKYLNSAKEKGDVIKDEEARKYFISDLNSEPWFGVIKK